MNQFLHRIASRQATICGVVAMLIAGICGGFHASPYNNYVLLADAFMRQQVWIPQPNAAIDALLHNGAYYIIEAPAPALFLMPFVAIYGVATNQSLLGVALCGIALGAAWNLMENMRVIFASRVVIAVAFFAGTDLFWCASLGDVWFIAHVSAVAMTMLALRELSAERRPWLIAFWACLAAESRFTMVLVLPIYLAMLVLPMSLTALTQTLTRYDVLQRLKRVAPQYLAVVAVFAIAWVAYNFARWGLPFDIGYTAWYHQDSAGSPTGSPFALRYLPYELNAFFRALPTVQASYPWLISPLSGIALEVTSPILITAFFARGNRWFLAAMWAATIITAAPSFIYYVDGYAQFGMRHALDFEPFLIVLMSAAMRVRLRAWQVVLCAYSAAVGSWGVWYWHAIIGR